MGKVIKPQVIEEVQVNTCKECHVMSDNNVCQDCNLKTKKVFFKTIFKIDKSFNVFCITDTKLSKKDKNELLKLACLYVGRFEKISDSNNKYVCKIISENKCKELIIEKISDCDLDLDLSIQIPERLSDYIQHRYINENKINQKFYFAYQVWEDLKNGIDIQEISTIRLQYFDNFIEIFINTFYCEFPESIYRIKIVTLLAIQKQLIK